VVVLGVGDMDELGKPLAVASSGTTSWASSSRAASTMASVAVAGTPPSSNGYLFV